MPSNSLLFRKNKIQYKWRPQIVFAKVEEEEKIPDPESDYSDYSDDFEATPEPIKVSMFNALLAELRPMRKTSKRILQLWTRKNKAEINLLDINERTKLLDFISQKFYDGH